MTQRNFSKVKESVVGWNNVQQVLRAGDQGVLVPVVIPRDRRGYTPIFWFAVAIYSLVVATQALFVSNTADTAVNSGILITPFAMLGFFGAMGFAVFSLWRNLIVEIEEGTTGILSSWGKIPEGRQGIIPPGRRFIWKPWEKVEYIVDTSTEIPYTAPVLSSPTAENVPLKSIEFFLKFRIVNPVRFVRKIGASNFDLVLSSAVQDAIRQRSRSINTADAYNLRGSDVGDMQRILNQTMERYGVQITGANIPDVQLPTQYQQNLATKERVAKELVSYEKEWDLTRKRRNDALELEIEKAKKERDARLIAVNEAVNKARQDVALMLQEKEAEAEKIKLDIAARGRAELKAAENQAQALQRLGEAYRDNQAVLQYELEVKRLEVAEELMLEAPRPLVVQTAPGTGDSSALSTLVMAQVLPGMMKSGESNKKQQAKEGGNGQDSGNQASTEEALQSMFNTMMETAGRRKKK
ncbi:MAG: SPFH domain-containing protein [Chloroflexota bacterium]